MDLKNRVPSNATLEAWLTRATWRLSAASAAQVRAEIGEHYESAREDALVRGITLEEADRAAVDALGDAKAANRQYRKVLLTKAEARMLRQSNWEARALCSRPALLWLVRALPVAALCASFAFFVVGGTRWASLLLVVTIGMAIMAAPTLVRIRTRTAGNVFRCIKWAWLAAVVWSSQPASLIPLAGVFAWVEWNRASIRRKLPMDQWPRQLFL